LQILLIMRSKILIAIVVFFSILLIMPFLGVTRLQELPTVANVKVNDILVSHDGLEWLIKTEVNDYLFHTSANPVLKAFKQEQFKYPSRCESNNIKVFVDGTVSTSFYFAYGGPQQEIAETVLSKEEDSALAKMGFIADNRNYAGDWGPRPLFRSWEIELKGQQLASNSVNTSQFESIQESCYSTTNNIETHLPEAKEKSNQQINRYLIDPWNNMVGTFSMPLLLLFYIFS
jgi:hypothetical protein